MPKPIPLSQQTRDAVEADVAAGIGCNAIARAHGISPSSVSTIAHQAGLWFQNDHMTTLAAENRRWQATRARLAREGELVEELPQLPDTSRARDGRETKAYRRLSYALYNVNRHHDRHHR